MSFGDRNLQAFLSSMLMHYAKKQTLKPTHLNESETI